MKIKIGTLHVEEGEFTEHHTEYPGDWRRYKQEKQDVPLYVSYYYSFGPPMLNWVIAEWPIYVHESKTTRREEGEDITGTSAAYWTKKRTYIGAAVLDKYVKWTPDIDFPEPELLVSKRSNEWVKKYTPSPSPPTTHLSSSAGNWQFMLLHLPLTRVSHSMLARSIVLAR